MILVVGWLWMDVLVSSSGTRTRLVTVADISAVSDIVNVRERYKKV